eukprot:gene30755-40048_t
MAVDGLQLSYGEEKSSNNITVKSVLMEYRKCLETAIDMDWKPSFLIDNSNNNTTSIENIALEHSNQSHLLSTSTSTSTTSQSDVDNEETISNHRKEEECVRFRLNILTASSDHLYLEDLWIRCVSSGFLRDSSLILNRHISISNTHTLSSYSLLKALKAIPHETSAEDICVWFDTGLKAMIVSGATSSTASVNVVHLCVTELCRRARVLEQRLQHPFDALVLANLSVDIIDSTPVAIASSISAKGVEVGVGSQDHRSVDAFSLLTSLRLQAAIRKRWSIAMSLDTVSSLGIDGFICDRLWSIRENDLTKDVHSNIRPLVKEFQSIAREVSKSVESSLEEALTEAIRLQQLRSLAFDYGIIGLDARDNKQVRAAVNLIASRIRRPNAIKDAIAFAGAWTSTSVDMSAVFTRAIVLRAMDTTDGVDHTMRTKSVIDALMCVPHERIGKVVEDVLFYLVESMAQICCQSAITITSSGCGNGSLSPIGQLASAADETEFNLLCQGALTTASWYCDGRANSNTKRLSSNDSSSNSMDVSWINPSLISDLKRLHNLELEFHICLSLNQLKDKQVRRVVATRLAGERAKEMLTAAGSSRDTAPLTMSLRRVCALLDVSSMFMTHTVMQVLLSSGAVEVSVRVAESLGRESAMAASSGAVPLPTTTGGGGGGISTSTSEAAAENADLLLDAAVTLCTTVAKQTLSGAASKPKLGSAKTTSNQSQSPLVSTSTSFSLSRDLLQGASVSAPAESIPRILDLLCGCNTVLAIHERLEGFDNKVLLASSSTLKSGSSMPSGSGTGSGGVSSNSTGKGEENSPPLTPNKTSPSTSINVNEKGGSTMGKSVTSNTIPGSNTATVSGSVSVSGPSLRISDCDFSRDGILMASSSVLVPLLKFITKESQRRNTKQSPGQGHGRGVTTSTIKGVTTTPSQELTQLDVDELVAVLQKSENHILAIRVMLGSWSSGSSKSQALRTSYLSLGRKILSYRDIDYSYAVACLSAVPYDAMVRELKAAVPSIQSDFSRLRTVAMIGEQLSNMWHQEELLLVFQSLQTNARWWHTLSSYGVKIDPRAFQSPIASQREACIRAVVPELLDKSDLNLSVAIEYCDQFDLEPSVASLCYVDRILLLPPTSPTDAHWIALVQKAATRIPEDTLLPCLRNILPKSCMTEASINSTTAVELDMYRKYNDISAFLSALTFPVDATGKLSVDCNGNSPYEGLSGVYNTRLPLWPLLEDPWGVIEPVMAVSPEIASKLAPLCPLLQLDRDEFYGRRAMTAYAKCTSLTLKTVNKSERGNAFQTLMDAVQGILSPLRRVDVWKWLYARERGHDDSLALKALDLALQSVTDAASLSMSMSSRDRNIVENVHTLQTELSTELRCLRCEIAVKAVQYIPDSTTEVKMSSSSSTLFVPPYLLPLLSDPPALLRKLLETSLEISWNMQLYYLCQIQPDVLCVSEMTRYPLCPRVIGYLQNVAKAADDIASQIDTSSTMSSSMSIQNTATTTGAATGTSVDSPPLLSQSASTLLEGLRSHIIGKLLADTDITHSSSKTHQQTVNSYSSSGWGGLWGGGVESVVKITEAETRRREDLYFGFSLAAVICSCVQESVRTSYISQLVGLAHGQGVKSMRRLTSRSRLRALFAMNLLGHNLTSPSATSSSDIVSDIPLQKLGSFLYCLAELQEIRLPCTETTLSEALDMNNNNSSSNKSNDPNNVTSGKNSSTSSSSVVVLQGASPAALVRTWLHDEGQHSEVSELSRDLLLSAQCHDPSIWTLLIEHMDRNGHQRALLTTIMTLRTSPVFSTLSRGILGSQFLRTVSLAIVETVERAEQLFELIRSKQTSTDGSTSSSSTSALNNDFDAVSVSEFGDGGGGDEFESASQTGSVRGGTSVAGTHKQTKTEDTSGNNSTNKHHRKILLVPRCNSRVDGTGTTSLTFNGQSPEDLAQNLRDTAALFHALRHVIGSENLRSNSSFRNELTSIWESSKRLLTLSTAVTASRPESGSESTLSWGHAVDQVVATQAERCGLQLLSSGLLCEGNSGVLGTILSILKDTQESGCGSACWRALAAFNEQSTSIELEQELDAVFLDGATTDTDTDQEASDALLGSLLDRAALTWDGRQTFRKAAKCLLVWGSNREDRKQAILRTLETFPGSTLDSLRLAADVFRVPLLLQDEHVEY